MTRNRAMAALGMGGESPPPPPGVDMPTQRFAPVLPPLAAGIDQERYEGLCTVVIRVDQRYAEPAVIAAARLWSRTPAGPDSSDRKAVALIARYLGLEAERVGSFNAPAALRRVNVERYLVDREVRQTQRSARTLKTVLFSAARILLPHEYPKPQSVDAPRVKRITAASHAQIRDWYVLAPTLPPHLARRLFILLDLCYGAGARSPDFKVLRGSSITAVHSDEGVTAVVALPNRAGGFRRVPVADPGASRRLLAVAREQGPEYLLPAKKGVVERNAANRIAEVMRKHGHRSVNAAALRNRWIIDLAERVPACLLLALGDVVDVQVLADQRELLRTFTLEEAVTLLKETHL
jgi:hypothetical protein